MKKKKSGYQKEKVIMAVSAALVMAAMTVTGIYIYRNDRIQEQGDNIVDFSALEDEFADDQVAQAENSSAKNLTSGRQAEGELDYDPYYVEQERMLNEQLQEAQAPAAEQNAGAQAEAEAAEFLPEDLTDRQADQADALPGAMTNNVGYAMIEREGTPGLGAGDAQAEAEAQMAEEAQMENEAQMAEEAQTPDGAQMANGAQMPEEAAGQTDGQTAGEGREMEGEQAEEAGAPAVSDAWSAAGTVPAAEGAEEQALEAVADVLQEALNLHFSESEALAWPIVGNILLNYSMDKTIYFPTLQQYKYNPSLVIASTQGTNVACAADGVVKEVYRDAQTGNTIVTSLGDGYELTYGQLENVTVEEGDFVEAGVVLGQVAAPTKYYTVEGTNVYFKLTKDGEPVNPLDYLG